MDPTRDNWQNLSDRERLRVVLQILRERRIPVDRPVAADLADRPESSLASDERIDIALHNYRLLAPELPVSADQLAAAASVSRRSVERLYKIALLKARLRALHAGQQQEGAA